MHCDSSCNGLIPKVRMGLYLKRVLMLRDSVSILSIPYKKVRLQVLLKWEKSSREAFMEHSIFYSSSS